MVVLAGAFMICFRMERLEHIGWMKGGSPVKGGTSEITVKLTRSKGIRWASLVLSHLIPTTSPGGCQGGHLTIPISR